MATIQSPSPSLGEMIEYDVGLGEIFVAMHVIAAAREFAERIGKNNPT